MPKIVSCPRCIGGQMFLNKDGDTSYRECLQCGYTHDIYIDPKRAKLINASSSTDNFNVSVKRGRLMRTALSI